ncbi:MAG: hypothetical protein OCD01_04435 [Fibrobacterales bacterium]
MMSSMVFNHHSLPFSSAMEADSSVLEFLKICIKAQNVGIKTVLIDDVIDKSWFRVELSSGYYWQDWFNSHNTDDNKDIIRVFRSVNIQQPLFRSKDIEEGAELFEVNIIDEKSYSAITAAAWHQCPLVSFPTESLWKTPLISIKIRTLNRLAEIVSTQSSVLNFFSIRSFENEIDNLIKQRNDLIKSGKQIVEQRNTFFTNVIFCGDSVQQLQYWSANKTLLEQVKESITVLNKFSDLWKIGTYQAYNKEALQQEGLNHRVSGESETVLNTPNLRAEREFWLPTGVKKIFDNHVKLSNGYRLHFYPCNESKNIYVGHIGPHLNLS